MKILYALVTAVIFGAPLAGCENEGPLEESAEEVEEAGEEAGDEVEDATE